jgi:hypothetical protein
LVSALAPPMRLTRLPIGWPDRQLGRCLAARWVAALSAHGSALALGLAAGRPRGQLEADELAADLAARLEAAGRLSLPGFAASAGSA